MTDPKENKKVYFRDYHSDVVFEFKIIKYDQENGEIGLEFIRRYYWQSLCEIECCLPKEMGFVENFPAGL